MAACNSDEAADGDLPLVAFLLQPGKVHRVVTPNLQACAAARGLRVCSATLAQLQQWQGPPPAILVHKLPCTADLEAALSGFLAQHPSTIRIDPPAMVRVLDDRISMLQPLAGSGLLLQSPADASDSVTVHVTCPQQLALEAPCSHTATNTSTAAQQVHAAGLQYPLLVKLRYSTAAAAAAAAAATPAAPPAAPNSGKPELPSGGAHPASTDAAAAVDGHAIGLVSSDAGVELLASGQHPLLRPPLVLQQYLAHGMHLYKLYVVGDSIVLATRGTLAEPQLQAALAAPEAAASGVCVLPRLSAVPKPAAAAHTACDASKGAALVPQLDGPQQGEASPPLPQWALQQLASYMRQQLQLNLFNMDIIVPSSSSSSAAAAAPVGVDTHNSSPASNPSAAAVDAIPGARVADGGPLPPQHCSPPYGSVLQLVVVDVNYFPGLDKVQGSEALLADYLARVVAAGTSAV